MISRMRWFLMAGLALCVMTGAYAVPPAYNGPLGNAEEPALRPYKAVWQGTKAIVHRTGKAFVNGNTKTPVLGTVEVGRGLRHGVVDGVEYTAKSVAGSPAPRGQEYKQQGAVNNVIDHDFCLRNVADCASTGVVYFPLQKAVDKYPVQSKDKQKDINKHARQVRATRKENAAKHRPFETQRDFARRNYIGERANTNRKPAGQGDLTRLAR